MEAPDAGYEPRPSILVAGYGRGVAALAAALDQRGGASFTAMTFPLARAAARRLRPTAIVVGADPDAGDRFGFVSDMAADGTAGALLYLAARADLAEALAALDLGAHEVICPPHTAGAIWVRLGIHLRRQGGGRVPSRTLSWGGLTLDLTSRRVLDGDGPLALSGREFALLLHLLEAGGGVVSRMNLLSAIWGDTKEGGAVLDATVHRLRRKLETAVGQPDLVETVRGAGYRLVMEPSGGRAAG